MRLRVALAQMPVTGDLAKNLGTIDEALDFAASEKADILLTPEGSLSGYTHAFDAAGVRASLAAVTRKARELHLGMALGTCFEETDGLRYNQIRFYDREGAFLGSHGKILRCRRVDGEAEDELDRFATSPLRTFEFGGIRIAGLICNDLWVHPLYSPEPDVHLTQQLARMGVRVVFHAVNGGRDGTALSSIVNRPFHESNLRIRALAGRLWIVTVDNCAPRDLPTASPGGVVDPSGEWVYRLRDQGTQFGAWTMDTGS